MSNDHIKKIDHNRNNELLHGSAIGSSSLIDQALKSITPEELSQIRMKALEEKLKIDSQNQHILIQYSKGKKVLEDHIDTFNNLDKRNLLDKHKINTNINLGAGNMHIESKSGATCFVASAAYKDPNHNDVIFLRAYRDSILIKHYLGKKFINFYWKIGPHLAKPVNKYPLLQITCKTIISNIVKILRISIKKL